MLQMLTQAGYQWLYFAITLLAMFLSAVAVFVWLKLAPKRRKRKRRHHGHGHINPTRAQVGGLPSVKSEDDQSEAGNPPVDPVA